MSLCNVTHQAPAQRILQQAFSRDRLPHAYLFHGPEGVGKEMLAMGLAQLLLCEHPVTQPVDANGDLVRNAESLRVGCGQCKNCRMIAADTHPDLHLIYRQLHRKHPEPEVRKRKGLTLGIDVIRHFLTGCVGLKPVSGRAKVFIIREADLLEPPAQNALLKTLEEPPPNTFLVLLVTALDTMLDTTRSRCQLVPLGPLPTSFVESRLADLRPECPEAQRAWYARACDGSLGRAVQWTDDGMFDANEGIVRSLIRSTPDQLPTVIKSWAETSASLGKAFLKRDPEMTPAESTRRAYRTMFQLAAIWFADVLKLSVGSSAEPTNAAFAQELERCAAVVDPEQASAAIRRLANAEYHLTRYLNTQLVVETLIGALSHVLRGEPIDAV